MPRALAVAVIASAWSAASYGCTGPPAATSEVGDAAASDASPVCDVLSQTCGAGAGCYWAGAAGLFLCAESLGLPRYHPCLSSEQCTAGDGCHLDDRFEFFCTGYCDHATYGGVRDPERCTENELCGEFDGDVGVCLGICDPLAPTCPDGLGCYVILDAADLCFPITGEGAPGDECLRSNDCLPGAGCVELEGGDRCATYCDHDAFPGGADPRCGEGEVCTQLGPGERIGACLAP